MRAHLLPPVLRLTLPALLLLLLPATSIGQSQFGRPGHIRSIAADAIDGTWSELGGPEGASGAIHDPVRDRLILFEGSTVWAMPLGGAPAWERLPTTGAPEGRTNFELAYDPTRDRILTFGGSLGFDDSNEVWALSLSDLSWIRLSPTGPLPAARSGAAWIHDPVRDRMVLFGGLGFPSPPSGPYRNDVWALSLAGDGTWTELLPTGSPPHGRPGDGAIYDPVRDRLVISGGLASITFDTWALTLSGTPTWTQILPAGTVPLWRSGYVGIYDPNGDRLVIHGGRNEFSGPNSFRADTWALSLGTTGSWMELASELPAPGPRSGHVAIHDPVRARLLIFGGTGPGGTPPFFTTNDAWGLSLTGPATWTPLFASLRPSDGPGAAAALDARMRRLLAFGGEGSPTGNNETWAFALDSGDGWSRVPVEGDLPAPRAGATAIYDPVRHRFVIFGGHSGLAYGNDTWALALDDPPRWTRLEPTGDLPGPRSGHTAVHDPVRDRMIIHGGFRRDLLYDRYGDTWALSFTDPPSWTRLAATGPVGPGGSLVHDSVNDRLVAFGGGEDFIYRVPATNDTWAFPLGVAGEWTLLAPTGTLPSARDGHTAVYDAGRKRMLLFAGRDIAYQSLSDAWELSLAPSPSWRQLSPVGEPPAARAEHVAIHDPGSDRMVIFGGTGGYFGRTDTWALAFETRTVEVAIDVCPGDPHNTISLHSRGLVSLAVFGSPDLDVVTIDLASIRLADAPLADDRGRTDPRFVDVNADGVQDLLVRFDADVMALHVGDTTVEFTGRTGDGTLLHGADAVRVVPRHGSLGLPGLQLTLPAPDLPARVEAFAVDGRRVWSTEVPAGAARPPTIDPGQGRTLRPGVYWLRVIQGGVQVAAQKFVWIK